MRQETINVYRYSELSDKAKERALDYARQHWSADSWQHEYEQLQYELSEAKDMLVGIPEKSLEKWVQDLIASGQLRDIKCKSLNQHYCEVGFTYNPSDSDAEDIENDIRTELGNFCLSFMRNAEDHIYSEEYWAADFEANEREFTESGDLF